MRARLLAPLLLALLCPATAQAQWPWPTPDRSSVTNQRLFDAGPYLMDHYHRSVERFEAEPVVPGGLLFLGDSITEGGDWPALTGDAGAVNRGIGGDVTFGVLERLDDVIRRRPAKLFLLIGINDIGKDLPPAVIADNVRRIAEAVRDGSPETTVYVQSLLPVNPTVDGFPQHYDKEYYVQRTNVLLREAAAAAGVRFVNLYPHFADSLGLLDARLTGDGLHLNAAGYAHWVEVLREGGYL